MGVVVVPAPPADAPPFAAAPEVVFFLVPVLILLAFFAFFDFFSAEAFSFLEEAFVLPEEASARISHSCP